MDCNVPKNVFVRNNLNTRYAADGSKDVQVEKELAKIDGRIAEITDRLVEQARQGLIPDIDEKSRRFLYYYVFVQLKRPLEVWRDSDAKSNERVDAILLSTRRFPECWTPKASACFLYPTAQHLSWAPK